jgi:hypothetical protein
LIRNEPISAARLFRPGPIALHGQAQGEQLSVVEATRRCFQVDKEAFGALFARIASPRGRRITPSDQPEWPWLIWCGTAPQGHELKSSTTTGQVSAFWFLE